MPEMSAEKKSAKIFWFYVFTVAILVKIYFVYYGYEHAHYLVPPGSDVIQHLAMVKNILAGNLSSQYPPGFHLLIAALSKIFNRDAFYFLTYWTPILIILPTLTIYFLLRQLFSRRVSVITASILLLTSNYPLFAFVDGNYPDMLAYGCFAVLMFAFLIRHYKTQNPRNLIWVGLFLFLTALTHHLTFVSVFSILAIFGFLQLFINLVIEKVKLSKKDWLIGLAVFLVVIIILVLVNAIYGSIVSSFLNGLLSNNSAISNAYLVQLLDLGDYPSLEGNLIWYGGILGLIYMVFSVFSNKLENKTKQLVLVWFFFFLIMSRLSASGLPGRFARELALPLTVSLGFLINYFLELNQTKKPITLFFGYGLLGLLIYINSSFFTGLGKLPDSFNRMIWFWPKDQVKLDYLAKNVSLNSPVLYNPNANLFVVIRSKNALAPLQLSDGDFEIARKYLHNPEDNDSKMAYNLLVQRLKDQNKEQYIFIDVKPPSNPSGDVYTPYQGFEEKNQILKDLAKNGQKIKQFEDQSALYKMF